jgi:hypothetical protein
MIQTRQITTVADAAEQPVQSANRHTSRNGTGTGLQGHNDKPCKRSGLNIMYGHEYYVILYGNDVEADYGHCAPLTMNIFTACNI